MRTYCDVFVFISCVKIFPPIYGNRTAKEEMGVQEEAAEMLC